MYVIRQGLLELVDLLHIGVLEVKSERVFRVVEQGPLYEASANITVAEYRTHDAAIRAFGGLVEAIAGGAKVYTFPDDEPVLVVPKEVSEAVEKLDKGKDIEVDIRSASEYRRGFLDGREFTPEGKLSVGGARK